MAADSEFPHHMAINERGTFVMAENLAIIPARGGSKRIPRKNIKNFCGKPIIAYSIKAALESGCFDEVMVSTDDEKIAETAKKYGAKVPFLRSSGTSSDFATVAEATLEVLREYAKTGRTFEYLANIYATAPFVTKEDLSVAYDKLCHSNKSMIMPLLRYSYPPQRSYVIDREGNALFKDERYMLARSQDLEAMYHEVGQYYIYRVDDYVRNNGMIRDNIIMVEVGEMQMHDIDSEEDWRIAEFKYQYLHNMPVY